MNLYPKSMLENGDVGAVYRLRANVQPISKSACGGEPIRRRRKMSRETAKVEKLHPHRPPRSETQPERGS
jgi:hypothetical protein